MGPAFLLFGQVRRFILRKIGSAKLMFISFLAFLWGCASDDQFLMLREDINRLEKRMIQVQKSVEETVAGPQSQFNISAGELRKEIELSRRSQADVKQGLEEIKDGIQVLRGKIEEGQKRTAEMARRLEAMEPRILAGLDALKAPAAAAYEPSPAPQQAPAAAPPPPKAPVVAAPAPEQVFQMAYGDYVKGRYNLAIIGFKDFLEKYPNSDLADDAQYWIGESYYSLRDFKAAKSYFEEVKKKYPASDKTPSALLKAAYSYLELGETRQGLQKLDELIANFPYSKEAELAKEKLAPVKPAQR